MKKYTVVILSVLFVLLSALLLQAADQRVVKVGAFNYYPAIFKDNDTVVKGFYVDALTHLGKRENIRFEYVFGSWSEGFERLKSGEVDLLTSVAYTAKRAKYLDYGTTPLLTVWGELYVPLSSEIDGIFQVQGAKVAVMRGDFNARHFIELVKKFNITCEFVEFAGFEDIFRAIAAHQVDAGVVNSTYGVAKQKEYGLRSTGIVFNPFDIYFAVAKGKNKKLLALLDSYLANWRHQADSPYNKARQKWSHGTAGTIQSIPRWLVNSFAVLLLLTVGSFVFNIVLKRQVRSKTRSLRESLQKYQTLNARQEALLAAVPDIIMEADINKVYTWSNSAGFEFFGEDVLGKEYADYFEREQNTIEAVMPLYEGSKKILYVESWQRRKDGEIRLLAWWCRALVDEQGVVTGTLSSARDITEQKMSEQALKESEQKVSEALEFNRSILRTSSIGILIYSPDGLCLFANEAAAAIVGTDVASLTTRNFHEIQSWRVSGIYETVLRALSSSSEESQEVRIETSFGKELWVRLNFSSVQAKDSKHLLVFAQDITERKKSEEAIQQRLVTLTQPLDSGTITFGELFTVKDVQQLQDEFARATGVASIITNPDGTPLTEPSSFTRLCKDIIRKTEKGCAACFKSDALLGAYNPDGPNIQTCLSGGLWDAGAGIVVGGQHIANWLIGQVRDETQTDEEMRAYAREIGADEATFLEAFHEIPSMSLHRFEQIARALFTLANQLSSTAYQNCQQARFINERNQAEEQMKSLSRRLLLATSSAHLGVWDLNVLDNSMIWDDRMFELYGLARGTFDPSLDAWISRLHPEDKESATAEYRAALDGEKEFDTVFRVMHPDGTFRHLKANGLVIRATDGVAERMIGVNADITAHFLADEAKAKLESQLLQAQKMESVGRLAGGVAHDFNNMLTVILGQAELGLMKIEPSDPLAVNFTEISKMAERSADLTQQLLAFARKQTVAPIVLNLNEAVTAMLKMLQRLIGENIHLDWKPLPDLWQVKMDPSQIDQLLANLCVNSRDAIEDTGKITIETENCTIDEDFCLANLDAVPGEYVKISVSDDGAGMDNSIILHIFEPFFTTKEVGKGTGLGLATVYGIVRQNCGFIKLCSEQGQGTMFSIYLPRYESKSSLLLTAETAVLVPRGRETILLVEDEVSILDIVAMMLEAQGYAVLAANTPGEAVKIAREHVGEIHLLMTDVIMPEMNGRDLAKNLLSLYPSMKRLFMSGYTADVIAHHGVLEEGVHFIQKPFSLPKMALKVRDVLDNEIGESLPVADRSFPAPLL